MANKIELTLDLKTNISKAQDIFKKIDAGKGFAGATGKEAKARFEGNWAVIEKFLKQASLTEDEFKGLNTALKNVFNVLNTYASKIENLSEKALKLQQKIESQEQARNKAEDKRNEQKDKVAASRLDVIQALKGRDFKTFTDKGNLRGGKALALDTIISKVGAGTDIGYKDSSGNVQKLQPNDPLVKAINEYNSANIKLQEFETKLNEANQALDNLTNKLKTQIQADQSSGTTSASLTTEVLDLQGSTRKGLSKLKEDAANKRNIEKENKALLENTELQEKQSTALGKAFKQFTLYSIAIRTLKSALNEAKQTVKELDKELTEQAMVTGLTRKETYALIETYQDLALATGATTKEIASVATEYIKQGKSIKEATVLTEAAVSAAKVARVSVGDSVNYLTTALNGFQLAAQDAMKVSDKFAAVAAASATDYDELAIALSKVASQANLAGMSIDYTTALLTKGLETTREAPETMGTALKTIIARMRELSDYGSTLEGDTDINNVEKQLAYVNIALRNTSGELRSTEDVLDELGQKWDTLNKNQQAAVAKALAGTRQQSRLIAMMSDYERVMELQQISQRSAGATAAQAGVYLEGMEASLNKITVAWEKIVTSLVDSEVVITTFNFFASALEGVASFTNTTAGSLVVYTAIAGLGVTILGNKLREIEISKMQHKLLLEQEVLEKGKTVEAQKKVVAQKQELVDSIQIQINEKKSLAAAKERNVAVAERLKMNAKERGDIKAVNRYNEYITKNKKEINDINSEIHTLQVKDLADAKKQLNTEQEKLTLFQEQVQSLESQTSLWGQIKNGASGLLLPLTSIIGLYQKLSNWLTTILFKKKAEAKQTDEQIKKETTLQFVKKGVVGLIIAGTAALIAGGVALAKWYKANYTADGAAKKVNKLSNEIYKLNEKANAIDSITKSYDELDKKLIKTKKDQEEINSLLDQAADKLSSEEDSYSKGVSEQDYYNSASSAAEKRRILDEIQASSRAEIASLQQEQLKAINKLGGSERGKMLNEHTTDSDVKKAQSALYAISNSHIYDSVDSLKNVTEEEATAIESVTSAMVANLSVHDAYNYANNPKKVQDLVDAFAELGKVQTEVNGRMTGVSIAEILNSDDHSLTERVNAYKDAAKALQNNKEAYEAFVDVYQEFQVFAEMNAEVVKFIDNMGWTNDQINEMYEGWKKLQKAGLDISEEQYKDLFINNLLPTLEQTAGNVAATIDAIFGTYLQNVENYTDAYNSILDIFADSMTAGMLNMGQNIEKLGNSINNVYEKAAGWASLKEDEKTEFLQDNADLFEGPDGAEMLKAFESGNYQKIQEALKNNENLRRRLNEQLTQIDRELQIEMNRQGDEKNEAYIKYLQEWKSKLQNSTEIFQADLELLIDQEQKQLDIYKEYLQKQQEQLEDSLEKRKEAYEEYFDAVNQQQADLDYEEERTRLITNISKLATSTDSASQKHMAELENQLMELEKERQQELRERAQEALIEGLDKNVQDINEKFDKLLDNEGLLLQAMNKDTQVNPNLLSDILYSAASGGQLTALNTQQYAQDLVAAFANSGIDTSNINEFMSSIQNNATFNLANGQTINLESDEAAALWVAIQSIMTKKGYGN